MKKIKNSVKAIGADVSFALFALFTAVVVGIRSYQLMYLFEPDTGFYLMESKGNFTIPLLYALVGASCIVFLLFGFLGAEFKKPKPLGEKNYYLATAAVLFAVSLVADGMLRFSDLFNQYEDEASETAGSFLTTTRSVPQAFEILFALLAALYFIIVAVSFYTGKPSYRSARVMSLTPVCWLMCRLISRFVRAVSFLHMSELFWELVMIVFLMIFFMGLARLMSGIGAEGKYSLTFGAGLCGAMCAFLVALSRVITYFVASGDYLSADSPIEVCDLGAAIFICVFLVSCAHDLSPKGDAVEPAAQKVAASRPPEKTEQEKRDDEAFLIADQYANRYLTEDSFDLDNEPDDITATKKTELVEPLVAGSAAEKTAEPAADAAEPAEQSAEPAEQSAESAEQSAKSAEQSAESPEQNAEPVAVLEQTEKEEQTEPPTEE